VAVDPDARIFRRLDRQEIAPILRRALLDPRTRVAVAGDDEAIRQAALTVAHATLEGGVRELDAMAADGPVFVIGLKPHVVTLLQRLGLPPIPASLQTVDAAFAYAGETDAGRAFVVVSAPNLAALAALARPLPHLGAQSYAVFDGARSVARGVWPREPPRHRITDR
jgi:hypothetical protein